MASPSCAHGILLLPVQAGWGAVVQGEGRAHPACSHDGEDRTREGCASCSENSRKWGQKQPRRAKTSWMDSRSLVNTMRVGGWRELCQGPQTSCLRMWPNPVHSPSRWLLVKHHQTPLLRSTTRDVEITLSGGLVVTGTRGQVTAELCCFRAPSPAGASGHHPSITQLERKLKRGAL